jgi:hypothetical protein
MGGSLFANEHYNINLYNINFINNVDSFIKSNWFGFGLYFTMDKDYPDSVAYLDGIDIVNSLFNSAMIKWVLSKLPKGSEIALGVGLETLAILLIALGTFFIVLGVILNTAAFFIPGGGTPFIVAGALLIALGLGILASVSYGIHTGTLGYTHTPDGKLIGWLQGFIATVIIVAIVALFYFSTLVLPTLSGIIATIVGALFTGLDIGIMYITDYIGKWIDPSLYRALFFIIFTSMIAYLVVDVHALIPLLQFLFPRLFGVISELANIISCIIVAAVNLGILITTDITHNNSIFFLIISIEFGLVSIGIKVGSALKKLEGLNWIRVTIVASVFLSFKLAGTYLFSYFFKQDKMNMAYIVGSIGRIGGPFISIGMI